MSSWLTLEHLKERSLGMLMRDYHNWMSWGGEIWPIWVPPLLVEIVYCSLLPGCGCNMVRDSSSGCLDFSAIMSLELWAKINLFSLELLLSEYFITTRKVAKTKTAFPIREVSCLLPLWGLFNSFRHRKRPCSITRINPRPWGCPVEGKTMTGSVADSCSWFLT